MNRYKEKFYRYFHKLTTNLNHRGLSPTRGGPLHEGSGDDVSLSPDINGNRCALSPSDLVTSQSLDNMNVACGSPLLCDGPRLGNTTQPRGYATLTPKGEHLPRYRGFAEPRGCESPLLDSPSPRARRRRPSNRGPGLKTGDGIRSVSDHVYFNINL